MQNRTPALFPGLDPCNGIGLDVVSNEHYNYSTDSSCTAIKLLYNNMCTIVVTLMGRACKVDLERYADYSPI